MYEQVIQQSMQEAISRHDQGMHLGYPMPNASVPSYANSPYNDAAHFGAGPTMQPTSKVMLHLACRNLKDTDVLSTSDPMVVVSIEKRNGKSSKYFELGRTEVVQDCLNPDFITAISLDYHFEELQRLQFEVYDSDSASAKLSEHDFLGRAVCTLGSIMGENSGRYQKDLETKSGQGGVGKILITAEEESSCKDILTIQFRGKKLDKKDFFGLSDPFLVLYRCNEDNSYTAVHKTEVVKNSLNPTWQEFSIPVAVLCNGDYKRTIKAECFDWDSDGGHDLIGEAYFDVDQLKSNPNYSAEFINPKKKIKKKGYKNSGHLDLVSFKITTKSSFLDYVQRGTELCLSVAVDCTASNGNPAHQSSLHFINPYQPNDYIKALLSVGQICQDYDSDKWFPAYGFGAAVPPDFKVSHQFALNGTENPNCYMVDGIIQAYSAAIQNIKLYGPTNFAPIINQISFIASQAEKSSPGGKYFILLILTDGIISDFDQTKEAIIRASTLPISIIIVGIGPAEFDAMEELDADKVKLQYRGKVAERDIVQFVPFRDFTKNDAIAGEALAREVLAEVPEQFLSYMKRCGIKPGMK